MSRYVALPSLIFKGFYYLWVSRRDMPATWDISDES
jgi:hypothetical protein